MIFLAKICVREEPHESCLTVQAERPIEAGLMPGSFLLLWRDGFRVASRRY